jgi:hypothetical protein
LKEVNAYSGVFLIREKIYPAVVLFISLLSR